MALFDNFPHKATIRRRTRTKTGGGDIGGGTGTPVIVSSDVECWEQGVSDREVAEYDKRGMNLMRKIYFLTDPGVTERHEVIITERNGTSVAAASQTPMDVLSAADPDATAGLGIVFRVMCGKNPGALR